ncbi:hypothetical protein C8J56DRAFT_1046542 [Mycena floridula]|nr:hypothetical protein C8J56DRAFT_1046542 [Mycena floridula]
MTDWTPPETGESWVLIICRRNSYTVVTAPFTKFLYCMMGGSAWEWLISLDFDLLFLLGQRKLKWPLLFYFYGRYASLGNLIGLVIINDSGHPVHCQAAYISTCILADTAICVATINLSIRTQVHSDRSFLVLTTLRMLVWAYDARIMATLIVLILGHFTIITLNILHGQVDWIATENGCILTHLDSKLNATMFIYTSGVDLIVMCLMAFKVFRYRQDKISTLLLRDGLIYFLVVFVVNVVAAISSLLNSILPGAPVSMIATDASYVISMTIQVKIQVILGMYFNAGKTLFDRDRNNYILSTLSASLNPDLESVLQST